jgi:S1-C subfamily serine protease
MDILDHDYPLRPASRLRRLAATAWLLTAALSPQAGSAFLSSHTLRDAVVKIYVTAQRENYAMPWQRSSPITGTGTGFYIGKRRILTNAHVVSDARFLEVQRDGDATRVRARVQFVGHDCDLAVLQVDDERFFKGRSPLTFADDLPELNETVTVLGFPLGGTRLSATRGVVSRIDYSTYRHSAVDQHLVLQVDAAINPGNSGGPVFYENRVVGLAFQGLIWGENIGYAIPVPVIRHFLDDVADGQYHGYPELGIAFMDTRNPAIRDELKIPEGRTGVVLSYIDPYGAGHGHLYDRDVLLDVDGYPIANDGSLKLDGNTVLFAELLERKQWGESIVFNVWRDTREQTVTIPLTAPDDPFVFRNLYDHPPEYCIKGGLVFSPLTRPYLAEAGRGLITKNDQQLYYYSQYAKVDGLHKGKDAFIVLIYRLPHPVNTYADGYMNGIVERVNGFDIRNLRDLKRAFEQPKDGFHHIDFAGSENPLILDAMALEQADTLINTHYRISEPEHLAQPISGMRGVPGSRPSPVEVRTSLKTRGAPDDAP